MKPACLNPLAKLIVFTVASWAQSLFDKTDKGIIHSKISFCGGALAKDGSISLRLQNTPKYPLIFGIFKLPSETVKIAVKV